MIGEMLKAYWDGQGLKTRPGISSAEISAFESRCHVVLPADLRDYFLTVNGFEGADRNQIAFWPFSSTADTYSFVDYKEKPEGVFIFADYLIGTSLYFIRLSSDANAKTPVAYHNHDYVIADSFTGFAEKYLQGKLDW